MDVAKQSDLTNTPAIEALRGRQARRSRWGRIGGGLVLAAIVIRGGAALYQGSQAQACDASEVDSALRDLVGKAVVKGGGHATVVTLDRIATVADGAKLKRCTAHIVLSDRSDGMLTYRVDPKNVVIEKID